MQIFRGLRSVVAFVLPAILGNAVLLVGVVLGRKRAARRVNAWLIGHLAPPLAGFSVRVSGNTAALQLRPSVVVFNHQSGVDPVVLARLAGTDSIGLAKAALRRHWLLGPMLRMQGAIFVNADGGNSGALVEAAARVRSEKLAVLIAPEGKRGLQLGRFRSGATRLAILAGAPVVPVVIHDSGAILPPGSLIMRPGQIRVTVLDPQEPHAHDSESLHELFRQALGAAT